MVQDCAIADWQVAVSGPLDPCCRRQIRNLRGKRRREHPSRASGTNFEAVPGPAHFNLRTRQAILHVRQGGLRIAD
eukprot:8683628-Alexandrium_andersonii.AAC.1